MTWERRWGPVDVPAQNGTDEGDRLSTVELDRLQLPACVLETGVACTVPLPVGTRVWNGRLGAKARFGEVMLYSPEYSRGSFPVRFDDQIWEMLDASYVTAVTPKREAEIRRKSKALTEARRQVG